MIHLASLHLAPILSAEKSRTSFYIAAGLLVAWALIVSLGLGLRKVQFPGGETGERAVIAISALLVLATVSTAVITSGGSTKAEASAASGSSTTLKLAADPSGQLRFNLKQLVAKAGAVAISLANSSPLEHNVTVEAAGRVLGGTPTFKGASRTVTLNLKPGTYTFYCSVPGHRQAGMEGALRVQ